MNFESMSIGEIIANGLLAMLVLAVLGGMFWGMIRGPKRTAKRIVVLVAFFIFALIITPLVSATLVKMDFVQKYVKNAVESNQMLADASETMDEVMDFALNVPLAILNIVVFWVLLFLFRYIVSPVFSKIFLGRIAPKKDDEGNKIKHSKLAGMGMGAFQGLVIFAFVFIPALGVVSAINKIDNYQPSLAPVDVLSVQKTGIGELDDMLEESLGDFNLNQEIRNLNTDIQSSPLGLVSKYSGLQLFGDMALGHLMTVDAKIDGSDVKVNVRDDIVTGFELLRDFTAVNEVFGNVDDGKELVAVFSNNAKVKALNDIVDKFFGIGIINVTLDSDFGEFFDRQGWLDFFDDFVEGSVQTVDGEKTYSDFVCSALVNLNTKLIKEDFKSFIEIMRLFYAEHQIPGVTKRVSLYRDFDNLTFVFDSVDSDFPITVNGTVLSNKQEALQFAFAEIEQTLTKIEFSSGAVKKDLNQQLFDTLGNMNVFDNLFSTQGNEQLYSMPMAKLLGMNESDVRINSMSQVTSGLSNIFIRIVKIGPTAYRLYNGSDIVEFSDILSENNGADINSVGEILEILTNRGDANGVYNGNKVLGLSNIMRKLVSDNINDMMDSWPDSGVISPKEVLKPLAGKLAPEGGDIAWSVELNSICKIVSDPTMKNILKNIDSVNVDDLVNEILNGDLLDYLLGDGTEGNMGSEIAQDMIVMALDKAVNESLDPSNGVSVNFADADSRKVVEAIANLAGASSSVTDWLDGDVGNASLNDGSEGVGEIVDLFGCDTVKLLADSGAKIELDSEKFGGSAVPDSILYFEQENEKPGEEGKYDDLLDALNYANQKGLFVYK